MLIDILRRLAVEGIGLTRAGNDVKVYRPTWSPPGSALTHALRAAIALNKHALVELLEPLGLRLRLCIPDHVPVGPHLACVLLWLDAERRAFSQVERCRWLDLKIGNIDDGIPRYISDLFAIESVVRERDSVNAARTRAAA